jgi:pSer/pThr/pTyr-binding forkhead associated (FHA) protein
MPRLVIKQGPGVGRDHALGTGACVVGRDPAATFALEDNLVSRQHFQVVQEAGAWFVEDLGSTNGTLVNGRKEQRVRLSDGDTIRVGQTVLAFVQKDMLAGARPAAARSAAPAGPPAPVRRRRHVR